MEIVTFLFVCFIIYFGRTENNKKPNSIPKTLEITQSLIDGIGGSANSRRSNYLCNVFSKHIIQMSLTCHSYVTHISLTSHSHLTHISLTCHSTSHKSQNISHTFIEIIFLSPLLVVSFPPSFSPLTTTFSLLLMFVPSISFDQEM